MDVVEGVGIEPVFFGIFFNKFAVGEVAGCLDLAEICAYDVRAVKLAVISRNFG